MAGVTTTIPLSGFPANSQDNYSNSNDIKLPSRDGQNGVNIYVSPTFKSSPLFSPDANPKKYNERSTPISLLPLRPRTQMMRAASDGATEWGTHIHQYAGIGDLQFLGNGPKTRDLYVARSHRHYLSGFAYVRHDKITRTQITPFKKAVNREHDDLVPPASSIPLSKYGRLIEKCHFVKEDKYASHQNKTEMFPREGKEELSDDTKEAIRQLLAKRYGQTTYSENFYDQHASTTLNIGPPFNQGEQPPTAIVDEPTPEVEPKKSKSKKSKKKKSKKNKQDSSSESDSESNTESDSGQDSDADSDSDSESSTSTTSDSTKPTTSDSSTSLDSILSIDSLTNDNVIEKDEKNDEPMWPCWPGHMSNTIDPVTLEIGEKRDVVYFTDLQDVRTLPMFQPKRLPDYKMPKKLDHATICDNKFAPAKLDFARSGVAATYGSPSERARGVDVIKVEKVGNSRFTKLPDCILDNVEKRCRSNNGGTGLSNKRQHDHPENLQFLQKRVCISPTLCPHPPDTRQNTHSQRQKSGRVVLKPRASTSIEDLQNTVSNLREPLGDVKNKNTEQPATCQLPPLWETLTYSSDRVVDHLGNRFKTAAQQRYHAQHKEKVPHRLYMPQAGHGSVEHIFNHMYASDLSRRRQYYNGYHMGSSYR